MAAEDNEKLFPEGIIAEILSRLPVKSLLRFRCVCKPWCVLITDPAFVKMHLNQSITNNRNLSIISRNFRAFYYSVDLDVCEEEEAIELYDPGNSCRYVQVLGSCNGLLCLFNTSYGHYLWNPSTRRHQKLPTPPIDSVHLNIVDYGFGYEPITDDYKLVRISQFGIQYPWDSEVNVYSLSTDSWRRVGDIPFNLRPYGNGSGVLTNSAIHWIAKGKTGGPDTISTILSFDLKDEKYGKVSMPDFVDINKFKMDVGVLGGQLCLLCNFFDVSFEVWVMKDYGVRDSWVKQFSIQQPLILLGSFEYVRPVCHTKNEGEVILKNKSEGLFLYDHRRERGRELRIRGVSGVKFEIEIFVGSLTPLNAKDRS